MSSANINILLLWSIGIFVSCVFGVMPRIYRGNLKWQPYRQDFRSIMICLVGSLTMQLAMLVLSLFVIDQAGHDKEYTQWIVPNQLVVFAMAFVIFFVIVYVVSICILCIYRDKLHNCD